MQREITERIPLLDERGNLTQAGYARSLLPVYDRSKVKGGFARLKEWDYYYAGGDNYGVALTIADNSYMGLDSISFLRFGDEPKQTTKSVMRVMPMGKTGLPPSSEEGATSVSGKGYSLSFRVDEGARIITAHMDDFEDGKAIDVDLVLTMAPPESMVICTPFDKPGHFYYNQKINCMRATGVARLGEEEFRFEPNSAFAVLDWGRGVWTYRNTWFWGSASGLVDGVDFGFNLGYGFGDTSAATENMLFYKGKAHKLEHVRFMIPRKDRKPDYMSPWKILSSDGRLELDFAPVIDRFAPTDFKMLKSIQHQVFGRFSGFAVLDDGARLEIKDLMGFAEEVENWW